MQGGVDVGYAILNRALEALVKADIPSAMLLTDAGHAYYSTIQDAAIEVVVKSRPKLVGFWATCYGNFFVSRIWPVSRFLCFGSAWFATIFAQGACFSTFSLGRGPDSPGLPVRHPRSSVTTITGLGASHRVPLGGRSTSWTLCCLFAVLVKFEFEFEFELSAA